MKASRRIVLVVTILSFFLSIVNDEGANKIDFDYIVINENEIRITGYKGWGGDIVVPSEIEGKPVTEFGYINKSSGGSMFYKVEVNSIEFPETLKKIGGLQLNKLGLTKLDIPDSVTEIGHYGFAQNNLTDIILPSGIVELQHAAFQDNKLKSISIPKTLTRPGNYSFANNELTSIIIEEGIERLGAGMFMSNKISSVEIPESLTEIETQLFLGNELIEINIPNTIDRIGDSAFSRNKLTNVKISGSVESIGDGAFSYNNLKSILIPRTVKYMGVDVFKGNQENAEDLIIYGDLGSTAEQYANHYGHTFLTRYQDWNEILTTADVNYTWTIKFNMCVDESSIKDAKESKVYILDENNEKLEFINPVIENKDGIGIVKLENDGDFIIGNTYYIIIEDNVRSIKGKELGRGLKVEFKVVK